MPTSTKNATPDVLGIKAKTLDKGRENVVAAIDALDGVSQTVNKSLQTVKRRIDELDEMVMALEAQNRSLIQAHDTEMQAMREQYTRETTVLQTKLSAAEEKLRKVQATLA